ncbi:glycerol-3-phosphate 1-O-acyltransferase PlsY [Algimonas porphyrae]|uniref:Glycerol-3-phosphate acyltransferase n=1 Tax=Algimonas porphyrae TaxID=1128113 RepID=A0ABQ5V4Y2_9PROT|nr:glycerol-3-phosphate 1-O-acyltransferase PlsY [Algimonas porphyrae]GLQ21337.1 glycerol-3-phosphate acyltransferase [Algimonas porphyrae]
MAIALSILLGYLLGSIPFGLLLTRLTGGPDIREIGSGNIGATNVLRTGNKAVAALTLLFDAGKAAGAGWIALSLFGEPFHFIAAAAALFGHCYPVWLKFKGGKGVATFFGSLLGLVWPIGLVAAATWLLVAFTTRYSSAAALCAAAFATVASAMFMPWQATAMVAFMTLLIIWRHRENIRRLKAGTESRIGAKADDKPA